ncbi:MAG: Ig-like domain-containing protein [Lachnospiraceae bacterium]|nr:Ig-like domain-containing protein [Lachnospiraceae bacterium]
MSCPTSIIIQGSTGNLSVGSTRNYSAQVLPPGANQSVNWSSSNVSVATVNSSGRVTAIKAGSATIRASSAAINSISATVSITVTQAGSPQPPAPASVAISGSTASLAVGATRNFAASVSPSGASQSVSWSSNNASVATVNSSGGVTARAAGNVSITARSSANNSISATVSFTVTAAVVCQPPGTPPPVTPPPGTPPAPASVAINGSTGNLTVGATRTFTASVSPSGANQGISWSSNNASIATVNSSGSVTAIAPGNVTITARSSGNNCIFATISFTVIAVVICQPHPSCQQTNPASITIAGSTESLIVGATRFFAAAVLPAGASQNVSWSSNNVSIATVSSLGGVTAIAPGNVTITARSSGNSNMFATVSITVIAVVICQPHPSCQSSCQPPATCQPHPSCQQTAPASVAIAGSAGSLTVGATRFFAAAVLPAGASQNVSWSSNNASIATVSSLGGVTAIAPGNVTITARSSGNSNIFATVSLTVIAVTSQPPGTCTCPIKCLQNGPDEGAGNVGRTISIPESISGVITRTNGTTVDILLKPKRNWFSYYSFDDNMYDSATGRIRICVGPKILDSGYSDTGRIWNEDFDLPRNVDAIIRNRSTEQQEILECIVTNGGLKAHTLNHYPHSEHPNNNLFSHEIVQFHGIQSGMHQTGIAYPRSWNSTNESQWAESHMDGSTIEFRTLKSKVRDALGIELSDYELINIIVYD